MIDDTATDGPRSDLTRPMPHPDIATLHQFGEQVLAFLLDDFQSLPDRSVGRTASRDRLEELLREPAPETGSGFSAVLKEFQEKVLPNTVRVSHPRFLAFVPGPPTFLSVLGDWLCAGTNVFAGTWFASSGASMVELVVLDWFRDLLGLPLSTRGILTSGGSEANLTALVVAREPLTFEERGRAVLYFSEQRHWSLDRAAKVMGLQPAQLRSLPTDEHFRLQPAALREALGRDRAGGLKPWLVAANAGATDTAAVDPLPELSAVCREQQLWLHVDAAYGWPAVLIPEGRAALAGIDRADSVTLDPHKWFAQTFEAGCVLVREGDRLAQAFSLRPNYMQDVVPADDQVNFCDQGIALTRRFRALKIWLSVKVLGLEWYRELVDRSCRLADLAQELLERAGCFEILHPRRLSIVCFRFRPKVGRDWDEEELDKRNLALVEELRATGRAVISSTRLRGRVALRFCFVNWRTTAGDVEEVVHMLAALAAEPPESK